MMRMAIVCLMVGATSCVDAPASDIDEDVASGAAALCFDPGAGPTYIVQNQQTLRKVRCYNSRLYWVEHYSGDVVSSNVLGNDIRSVVPAVAPAIVPSSGHVSDIFIGAESYLVSGSHGGSLFTLDDPTGFAGIITSAPYGRSIAVVSGVPFFSHSGGISTPGGPVVVGGEPYALVADANAIYWIDTDADAVMRRYISASTSTQLATVSEPRLDSLATTAGDTYWSDGTRIKRRNKIFATVSVAYEDAPADYIVPVNGGLLWAEEGAIKFNGTTLATTVAPSGLAACGGYAYWSTWLGQIGRVALP